MKIAILTTGLVRSYFEDLLGKMISPYLYYSDTIFGTTKTSAFSTNAQSRFASVLTVSWDLLD